MDHEINTMRDHFFSLYKVFWWSVYTLMLIGVAGCWIFINVKFLGRDVQIGNADWEPTSQSRHK